MHSMHSLIASWEIYGALPQLVLQFYSFTVFWLLQHLLNDIEVYFHDAWRCVYLF